MFCEAILAEARKAVEKHPESIPDAVECAERHIRQLPEFQEHINNFIRLTVQELVYRARVQMNNHARHVPRQKVNLGESQGIKEAYADLFGYFVAGRTLGSLRGEELEELAVNEQSNGEGYLFRARLLRLLRTVTPDGKTVQQAVDGKKLAFIFKKAEKKP